MIHAMCGLGRNKGNVALNLGPRNVSAAPFSSPPTPTFPAEGDGSYAGYARIYSYGGTHRGGVKRSESPPKKFPFALG